MKKNIVVVLTSVALLSMVLGPAMVSASNTIQYVGSSTVGKFIESATKVYKGANFIINTKPESGGGENATAAGKTDIGGVARDVKPAILGKGVKKYLIGKDAIGAWVNSKNPVGDLSKAQLKEIFTGKITNWKDVGGNDMPIHVYIVNPQSATRKVFSKAVLGGAEYGGKVTTVRPDAAIIDRVAANAGGIGQLSFALGNTHPKSSSVKKINIDGQTATVDNPNYPVTRPLYLITKGEPQGAVKDFIEWSLSDAGQKVVKMNFVGN